MSRKNPRPAILVARQILWIRHNLQTTPMQLVKLVYFSHAWMLVLHNRPLIAEPIQAWMYGPMVRVLYQRYKQYGAAPITEKTGDLSSEFDKEQLEVIVSVERVFRDWSGIQLSSYTHQPGTPWSTARSQGMQFIPERLIKSYYRRWMKKNVD